MSVVFNELGRRRDLKTKFLTVRKMLTFAAVDQRCHDHNRNVSFGPDHHEMNQHSLKVKRIKISLTKIQ